MITLATGLRVYLACGVTDMRKGMVGLAMLVQQSLAEDLFGGAVFAFRGRRAGLIKLIWHDGIGLCMLTKRLEHGQFAWPSASTTGRITLSSAPQARACRINWRRGKQLWCRRGGVVHRCVVPLGPDSLPNDPVLLQQMLRELHLENDKLRLLIQRLTRHRFGRRSEQLTVEQLQLGLEDLEQTAAANRAAQDASEPADGRTPRPRADRPARNHGALPAHLPRYEVVIDAAPAACPCCGGAMHSIGEVRAEQLDIVPAQLRVRVTRRARYACRACEGAVVVAEAPARPIDGGMPTEAVIAHVVISKFCDSLPLYRQSQMLARQGISLDRSTLSHWVGTACWWLTPLYELVLSTVLSSTKVFADDTTLPVLDPGRGRTKTGRLWCYAVDDRPWCGPSHPAAAYVYSEDRKGMHPAEHLARFAGVLQVDGYAGFKRLAGDRADQGVRLAFCWAHMRREFFQFHASTQSPLAAEVLARVAALYAIEAEIRGHPANHRRRVRQQRSRPIVDALHDWLHDQVKRVSGASDAIRHWPGLIAFLDDGRIEMDTNVVERTIRPHTLTRKNALFAGSDGGARHWAIAMTLIQTAKLNDVEPMAWLTDVLERVVSGRTKAHELHTLLPWNWTPPAFPAEAALAA